MSIHHSWIDISLSNKSLKILVIKVIRLFIFSKIKELNLLNNILKKVIKKLK